MKINRHLPKLTHVQWAGILFCAGIAIITLYFIMFIEIAGAIPTSEGRALFFTGNILVFSSLVLACWIALHKKESPKDCILHNTDWNGKCFKCGVQVFNRNLLDD